MNGRREDLALWRHYEAAAEAAASVVALSRSTMTDREPLYSLNSRQRLQLVDLLHAFAYNGRRTIELADELEPGTVDLAKAMSVRPYEVHKVELEIGEDAQPLTDESLWWVLGRIIHARELRIHYKEDAEVGTEWAAAPDITMYWTAAAFSVRSDYDGADDRHCVLIDDLVAAYVILKDRIGKAIAAAGFPLEQAIGDL
jgi:hypothetical protein